MRKPILNVRVRKILKRTVIVLLSLFLLIIIILPPLTKYMIEKYDVDFIGREITMDLPYINPLTGYVSFKNVKMYEDNSDSVFFSAKKIAANFELFGLLKSEYKTSEIVLVDPYIKIIQFDSTFNFTDIVEHLAKDSTKAEEKEDDEPVDWELSNVSMRGGRIAYQADLIPIYYEIKEFDINAETVGGVNDTICSQFSFKSGISHGTIKGKYNMNLDSLDFRMQIGIDTFDLGFLKNYLSNIANFANVSGNLDARLNAVGNYNSASNISTAGTISIDNFHAGKTEEDDYFAFKYFNICYEEISPIRHIYDIDSIHLDQAYFMYENYAELDNIQAMFGEGAEKANSQSAKTNNPNFLFSIGQYVTALSTNFFESDYNVKKVGIYDANFIYNDFSTPEKFSAAANHLTLTVDSIGTNQDWVDLEIKSKIEPYGDFYLKLQMNPENAKDFKIDYSAKGIAASMLNPYLLAASSFPLDRGTIELDGKWRVNNGEIVSSNNLLIIDPRVGQKQIMNGAKWLPIRLGMFFIRERGNVIDYEIPITGNLADPDYKFADVIFDILENIFIKPVTPIYSYKVKTIEQEIEKSFSLKMEWKKAQLKKNEIEFIHYIADYLRENKNASIKVEYFPFIEKEKQYIAFFEAKKTYMLKNGLIESSVTEDDSLLIDKLEIHDSLFTQFLKKKSADKLIFTNHERSRAIIGSTKINKIYNELTDKRYAMIKSAFENEGVIEQVKFNKDKHDIIPYDGFSFFKISYQGELPDYLLQAYDEMNNLNSLQPRKEYKSKRNEIESKKK